MEPVYQSHRATLFEGDNILTLAIVPPESIDCGIDSPPYFNMADYKDDRQHGWEPTLEEYLEMQATVRTLQLKAFKEGGVLAIVIDDTINNYSAVRAKGQRKISGEWGKRRELQEGYREKTLIDVTGDYIRMMRDVGWHPILKLTWDKGTGGRKTSFSAFTHEYILLFVKQTSGRRLYPKYFVPFTKSILRHKPASHPTHPCPFPVSLADEILSHIMLPGGTVMDVYCGTGNSGLAALRAGGSYVGLDLNCEWAVQAMEEEECPPRVVQLELLA